jgi:hypothetical protein
LRNNELVKHITLLQGQLFPRNSPGLPAASASNNLPSQPTSKPGAVGATGSGKPPSTAEPFAYVQSPVLFDPNLNMNYVATTTFSPAANPTNFK